LRSDYSTHRPANNSAANGSGRRARSLDRGGAGRQS